MRRALILGVGLLACSALLTACGGSSAPAGTPTVQQEAPADDGDAAEASPPAATLEPTATPATAPPFDPSLITPVPPPEWPSDDDGLLDPPDRLAAKRIADALAAEGFDLPGIDLYVFPLPGGEENMLVFDIDTSAMTVSLDGESTTPGLESMALPLIESEAYRAANIARLVINVRLRDEQGEVAYILIATQPADVFAQVQKGLLTEEEAQQSTRIEIRQVGTE
jgi:hypothetical protein